MKVLQVIDSLSTGGAEKVTADLTNILFNNGIEVELMILVNMGELSEAIDPEIKINFLDRQIKWSVPKMYAFSNLAREFQIIHVHLRHNLKYVFFCKSIFPFNAQIVFHDHFGDINIKDSLNYSIRWLLKKVLYIGPSKQLCQWAEDKATIPKERLFYIPNIIIPCKKNTSLGSSTKKKKLLLISNFRRTKNIQFAIELIDYLQKRGKHYFLDIVGKPVDKSYYNEVKALIGKYNLANSIRIIDDCHNTCELIYTYEIAIHTSFSETGPLVLWEYISRGLPFLSFDTGEVVNLIKKALPEFIVDNFILHNWEINIEKVLAIDDILLKSKMDQQFRMHCNEGVYAQKVLNVYRQAIKN